MKEFKEIPLYPGYAINEDMEVKNMKSGKILNRASSYKGNDTYRLMRNRKLDSMKATDLFICAFQRFDLVV